ncbi:MAG: type II secretion system protein [Sideroxyarcus sp.]|nr:type II secretion system protein [Sideroxyarcus sp.]
MMASLGAMLLVTGEVWHTVQRREQEKELLFVGNQFRQAIEKYYTHSQGRMQRYPLSLDDLLRDSRYPSVQRYLRRIYRDPVSGTGEWGLMKGPEGEIYGVYSLSEQEPLKQGNFSPANKNFEGKTKYADWVFMHMPAQKAANLSLQP